MTATKSVRVEFGGGLELLFSNQKSHKVELPATVGDKPTNVDYLIHWLKDNLLKERVELFIEGNTVWVIHHSPRGSCTFDVYLTHPRRPGILVLINDTDWELEEEGNYVLENNDEVVFISTLHGG